jgi:adenylylsulfate kinase
MDKLPVVRNNGAISKEDRRRRNGHKSVLLWFTGLSGSGKTTLAYAVEEALFQRGLQAFVLDGDNIRLGLNRDLGFSPAEREENIRRIGEVGKLFVDAGIITLAAFISPYAAHRDRVRSLFSDGEFFEIYLDCDLGTCERRDPRGLYKKARAGEIPGFTGIGSPYEPPSSPDLVINTANQEVEKSVSRILDYLVRFALKKQA